MSVCDQSTNPELRTRNTTWSPPASRLTQAWARSTRQPHPGQPRQMPVWNALVPDAARDHAGGDCRRFRSTAAGRRFVSGAAQVQRVHRPAWPNQETRLEFEASAHGESENWSPGAVHSGAPAAGQGMSVWALAGDAQHSAPDSAHTEKSLPSIRRLPPKPTAGDGRALGGIVSPRSERRPCGQLRHQGRGRAGPEAQGVGGGPLCSSSHRHTTRIAHRSSAL
jgi:hypothetical protein